MQVLYTARSCRYDLLRATGRLATMITRWTEECDKRLHRLMCYIHSSLDIKMVSHVGESFGLPQLPTPKGSEHPPPSPQGTGRTSSSPLSPPPKGAGHPSPSPHGARRTGLPAVSPLPQGAGHPLSPPKGAKLNVLSDVGGRTPPLAQGIETTPKGSIFPCNGQDGPGVRTYLFADSDFAGCKKSMRSTSGTYTAYKGPRTHCSLSAQSKKHA